MGAARDMRPPRLRIEPPLVNSANPWATTLEDLERLYNCPSIGAVTTRTSLIQGFKHEPAVHQFALCDSAGSVESKLATTSFNSLGYSPIVLAEYLTFIKTITSTRAASGKGFIVSVTGTPHEVAECYAMVARAQEEIAVPLAVEVNLSCPNIPDKPPPAYDGASILDYVAWLCDGGDSDLGRRIPLGIKTPPYTYSVQYTTLVDALLASAARSPSGVCPVSFITATNTLGSCLMVTVDGAKLGEAAAGERGPRPPTTTKVLPGTGIGGMAGAPLHPLALGNVATIRRLLDEHRDELGHIQIIGVGGVSDAPGYRRMRAVGADMVGVGTALGARGVGVFEEIESALGAAW